MELGIASQNLVHAQLVICRLLSWYLLLSSFNHINAYNNTQLPPQNFSTEQKILSMVNSISADTNPYGYSIDRVLSGIERNQQGDIVAAAALPTRYLVRAEITV